MMNRRTFLNNMASITAGGSLLAQSALFAAGSECIKVGIIGCGSRGKGALRELQMAAQHLNIQIKITAIADFLEDRVFNLASKFDISSEICYSGISAYKKVLAADIDVVLIETPPVFHPVHFEAAIQAGKHVFMEKPAAVDPPGARSIMQTGLLAQQKHLTVITGNQRRHEAAYIRTCQAVQQDAIGRICGGRIWWCQKAQRLTTRMPEWSDAEYMLRNWISFAEMSGDHIVEQHVHNIDVANWFIGRPPETAMGFGGRARRKTGNQFDFFSVDFDYGNDVHVHSMCRQIDGCYDRIAEFFYGTKGSTWGTGPDKGEFKQEISVPELSIHDNPYVQEHVVLLDSILHDRRVNQAECLATSTLTALMGRISAYSGQMVRWKDLTEKDAGSSWYDLAMSPGPLDFENDTVKSPEEDIVPMPGKVKTLE